MTAVPDDFKKISSQCRNYVPLFVLGVSLSDPSYRHEAAMTLHDVSTTEEARIRALIEERNKALGAKDASALIACRADDFLQYSLAPPLAHRTDAANLQSWFDSWQGPIGTESRDVEIAVSGNVAFSNSFERMTGTKTNGDKADLWYRQTLCFRKIGGAWKVTNEHTSVPFYMDGSFRAAGDLKPSSPQPV
jgi:PhnB protein